MNESKSYFGQLYMHKIGTYYFDYFGVPGLCAGFRNYMATDRRNDEGVTEAYGKGK